MSLTLKMLVVSTRYCENRMLPTPTPEHHHLRGRLTCTEYVQDYSGIPKVLEESKNVLMKKDEQMITQYNYHNNSIKSTCDKIHTS